MFETTTTGYRATQDTVDFWDTRDTCPACGEIHTPASSTNGVHVYTCGCEDQPTWTRPI